MSVLSEILADKRTEIDLARRKTPLGELQRMVLDLPRPRDFVHALASAPAPALIAEVKRSSPSKGILRHDFDPVAIAMAYAENGAACVSVLTDERHFGGSIAHLGAVRAEIGLPLLRKDFIIDEYQVVESRVAGGDAVLLIAAALQRSELLRLSSAAAALGLAVIVEVHDESELDDALATRATLIGINNRDLHVFRTAIETTLTLAPKVPSDRMVVSESGIKTRADVERLGQAGVRAVLVGEALIRADDVGAKVRELVGHGVNDAD